MFGKKKGPSRPTPPFAHAEGCKLLVADPSFQPKWQEVETGHWRRECQCYGEDIYEPRAETRTRLDSLDPSTSRHMPQCEHRNTTDPAILRAILRVREGAGGDYWVVDCGVCEASWQVAHHTTERAG